MDALPSMELFTVIKWVALAIGTSALGGVGWTYGNMKAKEWWFSRKDNARNSMTRPELHWIDRFLEGQKEFTSAIKEMAAINKEVSEQLKQIKEILKIFECNYPKGVPVK